MPLLSSRRLVARIRPVVVFWVAPCSEFRSSVTDCPLAAAVTVPSIFIEPSLSVSPKPERKIISPRVAVTSAVPWISMRSPASKTMFPVVAVTVWPGRMVILS